jgi:glycosyltransferase involved in cell wall biosynthesis
MKIATMVRGYIPAPRPNDMVYAPIDLAVAISEFLTKWGHSITFFGPNGTSSTCATVVTNNLRALVHNQEEFKTMVENTDLLLHGVSTGWDNFLARDMFERARQGEFDLLHFQHPEVALPYVHLYPEVPVVYTLNDPIYPDFRELLEMYHTPNQFFVSISNNQRLPAPDLNFVDTVYNGVDTELFSYSDEPRDDYLLAAGRIVPEKGIKEAIQVAQATDSRLLIIGPVYSSHQEYFDQHIKPHLNEKILYLGFVEQKNLVRYFQKAKAFLMPIQWEEPFGLTMAEAMACGTPVIALNRGSVPEVLVNKKTGYIVNSVTEMIEMVKKVKSIKPENCRKHVEENFSFERMVKGYEAAFTKVIETCKQQSCSTETR